MARLLVVGRSVGLLVAALATCSLLVALAGCTTRYTSDAIEGRVVDASTGEPLKGVVVAADWGTQTSIGVHGTTAACSLATFDAVTGPDGRYRIPGWGPREAPAMVHSSAPHLVFFMDGYEEEVEITRRPGYHGDVPSHIESEANGKTIQLVPFDGTLPDYRRYLRVRVHTLKSPMVPRKGCLCRWEHVPSYTAALLRMNEKLRANGVTPVFPRAEHLKEYGCTHPVE